MAKATMIENVLYAKDNPKIVKTEVHVYSGIHIVYPLNTENFLEMD